MPNEGSPRQRFDELTGQLIRALNQVFPSEGKAPLVAVSVSGGADSCFLAMAFAAVRKHRSLDLHVLHVNHGLRPNAQKDAVFVRGLADDLKLPIHCHQLAKDSRDSSSSSGSNPNLQDNLRRKRYRWLSSKALALAGPGRIPVLATGHHAGDQVETILMNLVRGTHLYGLRGIQAWQTLPAPMFDPEAMWQESEVHLFRPLLSWDRPSIEAQLRLLDQDWKEDPSNEDISFLRNRIRHQLVPALQELNSQFVPNLSRQSREWTAEIETVLDLNRETLVKLDPRLPENQTPEPGIVVLDRDRYKDLPGRRRRGVLHAALRQVKPGGQGISYQRLERLDYSLCKVENSGGPWRWFGGMAWSYWVRFSKAEMGLQPVSRIISLHRMEASPFPLNMPLLVTKDWKATLGPIHNYSLCTLPATDPTYGWVLRPTILQGDLGDMRSKLPQTNWEALIPLEKWTQAGRVSLAAPMPKSRIQPIGMNGHSKSLRNILRDRKIHRSLQEVWPTLYAETGEPFWLCGLHLDQRFIPAPQTCQALRLAWIQEPVVQNPNHVYP